MRSLAYLVLAAVYAVGCGENPPAPLSPDVFRDASVPGDAGPDGGTSPDGGIDMDGSVGDAGPDGGDPDGGGSWCVTSTLCPSCPDVDRLCDEVTPCPVGEACVSTGCEDLARCFTIGAGACNSDPDCGNPAYVCNTSIGRCLRIEPGCSDSNDCVAGFACEGGSCVDRRVPCTLAADCPHGFTCFVAAPDQRFCRRIQRPCADDIDCLVFGVPCGDADGDGAEECMPSLTPTVPSPASCDFTLCPEADSPVCETVPQGTRAVCGRFGACQDASQCAAGFECRDLWGDRRAECVLPGGFCVDSSDCGPRAVCATPRAGGAPTCVGPGLM
jgi:hypothetical protein